MRQKHIIQRCWVTPRKPSLPGTTRMRYSETVAVSTQPTEFQVRWGPNSEWEKWTQAPIPNLTKKLYAFIFIP